MDDTEKLHNLTENSYKNLLDNFTPSLKQFITAGKAYHRALQAVSHCAKTYIEALTKLIPSPQHNDGYSISNEISIAYHQLTDVFKEIHGLNYEYMQVFDTELISPLESRLENEHKNTVNDQKRYQAGTKYHAQNAEKARNMLAKIQKRGKSKGKMQPREMELLKSVCDREAVLNNYRVDTCRKTLLEERSRYCHLMERICLVVSTQSNSSRRVHEVLNQNLPLWIEATRHPNVLPNKTEDLLRTYERPADEDYPDMMARLTPEGGMNMNGHMNRQDGFILNGMSQTRYTEVSSVGPQLPSPMVAPGKTTGSTLPRTITVPSPVSAQGRPQVRAIYTHIGKGEHTLSFTETDIITLIGEAKDGWQYGENTRSSRFGWFPISFTEPLDRERASPELEEHFNGKSLSKSDFDLSNGFDNHIYDSRIRDGHHQSQSPIARRSQQNGHVPVHSSNGHLPNQRLAESGNPAMGSAGYGTPKAVHRGPNPQNGHTRPLSMHNIPTLLQGYHQTNGVIHDVIHDERKSMPDIRPGGGPRAPPAPPPPPPPPGLSKFKPVHRNSPPNLGQDPYGHVQKPHPQHPQQQQPPQVMPRGNSNERLQVQFKHNNGSNLNNDPYRQGPPAQPPAPHGQSYPYADYNPYGYLNSGQHNNNNNNNYNGRDHGQGHGRLTPNHSNGVGYHGNGDVNARGGGGHYYGNGQMIHPPADYDDDDQGDNEFARQKQLLRKAKTSDRSQPQVRR